MRVWITNNSQRPIYLEGKYIKPGQTIDMVIPDEALNLLESYMYQEKLNFSAQTIQKLTQLMAKGLITLSYFGSSRSMPYILFEFVNPTDIMNNPYMYEIFVDLQNRVNNQELGALASYLSDNENDSSYPAYGCFMFAGGFLRVSFLPDYKGYVFRLDSSVEGQPANWEIIGSISQDDSVHYPSTYLFSVRCWQVPFYLYFYKGIHLQSGENFYITYGGVYQKFEVGPSTTYPIFRIQYVSAAYKYGQFFRSDIVLTDSGDGIVLTSPNGTRYRITVDDTGSLVVTSTTDFDTFVW